MGDEQGLSHFRHLRVRVGTCICAHHCRLSLAILSVTENLIIAASRPYKVLTTMKKVHLIFGVFVVLSFLLTGQYMDKYYNHMIGVPDGPRLLYRTRHIFILLAGLLNLAIGAYFTYRIQTWRRAMQVLGSLFIFAASFLFLIAFFYEPNLSDLHTPLSHWGTYTIATGALLHVISGIKANAE